MPIEDAIAANTAAIMELTRAVLGLKGAAPVGPVLVQTTPMQQTKAVKPAVVKEAPAKAPVAPVEASKPEAKGEGAGMTPEAFQTALVNFAATLSRDTVIEVLGKVGKVAKSKEISDPLVRAAVCAELAKLQGEV